MNATRQTTISGDVTLLPSWVSLMNQLRHHNSNDDSVVQSILTRLSDLRRGNGTRKVPVVAAVVLEVRHSLRQAHPWSIPILLRDSSATVDACVHRSVLLKYPRILDVGTAVLLKDVTALYDGNWEGGGLIICCENVVALCMMNANTCSAHQNGGGHHLELKDTHCEFSNSQSKTFERESLKCDEQSSKTVKMHTYHEFKSRHVEEAKDPDETAHSHHGKIERLREDGVMTDEAPRSKCPRQSTHEAGQHLWNKVLTASFSEYDYSEYGNTPPCQQYEGRFSERNPWDAVLENEAYD